MAYTTIDKPTDYFNTVLYTGNGTAGRTVTGVGFQPQWLWIKERSNVSTHSLTDIVRGASKRLQSSATDAEFDTGTDNVRSFDSDGFTVGTGGQVNENTETYVCWNWLAGGTASSNTDGGITSSVSANTTAGFSIVSYTGTGSAATVGHGLGVALSLYIVKNRSSAQAWRVFVSSLGADKILRLNATNAPSTDTSMWNNTSPTSSVFSIGTPAQVNTSGENYIAYCFAEKKGYSKFGSYTGDGNANGNFNYLGFKPSFILLKGSNTENWSMYDNKRLGYNVDNNVLYPNASSTEGTSDDIDFLSNGFKIRRQTGLLNDNNVEYIYMAFAEAPFVTSTGIPTTAR